MYCQIFIFSESTGRDEERRRKGEMKNAIVKQRNTVKEKKVQQIPNLKKKMKEDKRVRLIQK